MVAAGREGVFQGVLDGRTPGVLPVEHPSLRSKHLQTQNTFRTLETAENTFSVVEHPCLKAAQPPAQKYVGTHETPVARKTLQPSQE
jgi:hypothetical protein